MAAWETCPRAMCHRHTQCLYPVSCGLAEGEPPAPAPSSGFLAEDFGRVADLLRVFANENIRKFQATLFNNFNIILAALDLAARAEANWQPIETSPRTSAAPPLSLTGLVITVDTSLSTSEVRVHPDIAYRVRRAFVEADVLRSVLPFTSVGDEGSVHD